MIETEKQLWQRLKKAYPNTGKIKMTRIETPTKNGVPDVCYTNGIINGWIELKVLKLPETRLENWQIIERIKITANQITWAKQHNYSFVLLFTFGHFILLSVQSLKNMCVHTISFYELIKKFGLYIDILDGIRNNRDSLEYYLTPYLIGTQEILV